MLRFLLALLLCASAGQAQRLPEQVVASGPQGQVVIRRTTQGSQALLVANLDRPRRALVADRSLAAHPMPPIAGRRALLVRGWSGGAYCCFTLHILRHSDVGWHLIASIPTGKAEALAPLRDGALFWLPDSNFDFWDIGVSLGTDLRPPIPWSWHDGRFAPRLAAMRRPAWEALGEACTRRGQASGSPPAFASLEAAMTTLPQGSWSQDPRGARSWRPEAEFARRALCLLHAGHGDAALQLMTAWPVDRPQRDLTLRQLRARLLCGGFLAELRMLNGAAHPWLSGSCDDATNGDTIILD